MSNGQVRATPRELFREFLRGATRPSLPALAGCLLVAGFCGFLCFRLITPGFLTGPNAGYLYENSSDEYAGLSSQVLRLKAAPNPGPSVFYFGASAMREAISGAPDFQARIREKTGEDFSVYNMTAGGLTTWEIIALVDNLPPDASGFIVMPISPSTLSRRADRLADLTQSPRLAMFSPSLNEERRLQGLPTHQSSGNFFRDNYKFFLARLGPMALNLVRGPVKIRKHPMDDTRPLTPQEWAAGIESRARWVTTYASLREENLSAFRRLLGRLADDSRFQVILVEGLWNPRAWAQVMVTPDAEKTYALYRSDVEAFIHEYGVNFMDMEQLCGFEPSDFIDTAHIVNKDARMHFTSVLADTIAAIQQRREKGGQ